MVKPQVKHNWYGYVDYFYPRAQWMEENCLIGDYSYTSSEADMWVNDELMQNSPNYNCVSRTYEGFNNVLEDLQLGSKSPLYRKRPQDIKDRIDRYVTDSWTLDQWIWAYIYHRATGSGFSGMDDHGYRNNIVTHFGLYKDTGSMIALTDTWKNLKKPMVSTIGNMAPFPKKGQGLINCLNSTQLHHARQTAVWLKLADREKSQKQVTDWLNDLNVRQGMNRWNFPFAMTAADIATYQPEYVDPMSDLYCGKNAVDAINQMYEKPKGWTQERLNTYGLQHLTDILGTSPMAHEDTLCIYTRFLKGISRTGDYSSDSGYTFKEKQ